MNYELFYLIGASREAEMEKIKEDVEKIVKDAGGEFSEKETVEKRRMAYEIRHETHGIYVARRFELESDKINDVRKKINLYPGVTRFIISRADELPELKSKEERIAEATSKSAAVREEAKFEKKAAQEKPKEETPTAKEEKKPEKPANEDDIDKKLEEILNI